MLPALMGLGAIASLGGGIIGSQQGAAGQAAANRAYQEALAQIAGVHVPSVQEQMVGYETPELVGEYAPTLEATPEQLSTAYQDINVDPRLKQAQMDYLSRLSQLGQGGMNMEDRAAWDQIQRQAAAQEEAQQKAIIQNMAQRGTLGSGMELAARLQASQSAADRASQEGMQMSAQAQKRGLEALAQAGGLAGQVRGQETGEQENIARAKDVMGQFNLQNALQTRRGNVEEQRQAQMANLQAKQALANQAAQIRNLQEQQNKGLYQQQYQNEMARAAAMSGQYGHMGDTAAQAGQAAAQNWANIGGGIGSIFAGQKK